ncbi:MAG: ATP-binding protein [Marinobacterium sp.]|nr:ATP-binding protein [Marinobacterium sp.]
MSLRWKTILGIALIEGLLLLLLIYTTLGYLRSSNYDGLLKRAQTTAALFATTTKDAVLSYDLASLETFTAELMTNPDLRYVRVLGAEDEVFSQAGDEQLLAQPFQPDQAPGGVTDGVFDVQASIVEGGERYGLVQIGIATESVEQAIADSQNWSITIASIEMALVALFSFVLGTYLTAQLAILRRAARQVEGDNLDVEIPARGRDEVAEVGHAFNAMIERLKQARRTRDQFETELQELNQSLEARVERRTAALLKSNAELKTANRQIQETQAQLLQSEKMASLGQMAAGVAHEINNPVGFVMSNINSLQSYIASYQALYQRLQSLRTLPVDSEVRRQQETELQQFMAQEDFEFINEDSHELIVDTLEGCRRIRDIVQGLKEFSHIDQTEMQLTDLNQCLETTLKIVNNELKYRCDIRKDMQPLPEVLCNPGQLNQVFMNLLVNAGHAVEDGGVVGIRTRAVTEGVEIRIFDNGCGIAPEHLDKLFDPFFTTKPVGEGTGLGLAISYGIIEDHQGNIEVKSRQGVGTSFIIRLPVSSSTASSTTASSATSSSATLQQTLLQSPSSGTGLHVND